MLAHILLSTLLIKSFAFQWSFFAAADDEHQHELETRGASTTPASATGASDLSVGGGLVRARPPPTLLASGCASAPCGLRFQLGCDAVLKKTIRRMMLKWDGHRLLEKLTGRGRKGSAGRGPWKSKSLVLPALCKTLVRSIEYPWHSP